MTEYLPYIFGIVSLLGGIYLFLYFFRIYRPKHKTVEDKLRYEKTLAKFGTISKIASIFMIISGSYDLLIHDTERYTIDSSNKHNEWTKEDRDQLINECIIGAGKTGEKYPILIKEYCECSTDKIMSTFTKDQYIKDTKMPQDKRMKMLLPVFQDCLNNFKIKIDSVNNKY